MYLTKYWYSLLHLSLGGEEKKVRMDLYFDPDLHPGDTYKSCVDFVKRFELRYDASYPDPPKTTLDAALSRWKVANKKDPSLEEYDSIDASWKSLDMVRKCLGLFSSPRLNSDWELVGSA